MTNIANINPNPNPNIVGSMDPMDPLVIGTDHPFSNEVSVSTVLSSASTEYATKLGVHINGNTYIWVCKSCGNKEYPLTISIEDVKALSCSTCGSFDWVEGLLTLGA